MYGCSGLGKLYSSPGIYTKEIAANVGRFRDGLMNKRSRRVVYDRIPLALHFTMALSITNEITSKGFFHGHLATWVLAIFCAAYAPRVRRHEP